jgi:fructose-bisphosphate aldolase class II
MQTREAAVDRDLVTRLRDTVPVPLVLHGSSGLSDEELQGAVRAGMTKVNISTHLNGLFTRALRAVLEERPDVVDPRKYVSAGRDAITAETRRLLTLRATA